jgi:hypothetical protein
MRFREFNDLRVAKWYVDDDDNFLPVVVTYQRPVDSRLILQRYADEVAYAQELVPDGLNRRVLIHWKPLNPKS